MEYQQQAPYFSNEKLRKVRLGKRGLGIMLNLEKWMALFLEQYRFEDLKLGPKDKQYLTPFVKEQRIFKFRFP